MIRPSSRVAVSAFILPTLLTVILLHWVMPDSVCSSPADDREGAQAFIDKGRQQIEKGEYGAAARLLGIAVRKDPTAPEAYLLRGIALDRLGLTQNALKDLDRFIELRPSEPEGYLHRGDVKNFNMQHEEALSDYAKAVQLAPSSASAYMGRGLALTALGRYEEAIKDYLWVLRLEPHNQDVHANMGIACMLAGKRAQAVTYFEKALLEETNPRWRKQIQEWISRIMNEAEAVDSANRGPTRTPAGKPRPMW
ncbi:MAG: tetratricopeptide repeat protein [Thermodesulfobacteriota bacterium]